MAAPAPETLLRFLIDHLALSTDDLVALRDRIDAHVRERARRPPGEKRRTLYLPEEPLDEL